ncbi:MAG: hypothetical protein N2C12_05890 [Planctomycetales bacterium]
MLRLTNPCLLLFLLAAATADMATADETAWTARKVRQLEGFDIPECVLVDTDNNTAYVSNVAAEAEGEGYERFWTEDRTGFISKIDLQSSKVSLNWRSSSRKFPFSGPKGMCILDGWLYVTDLDRVLRFKLDDNTYAAEVIEVRDAKGLNDMATDGKSAFVTDSGAGKCYRLNPGGEHDEIKAPEGINGITFHDKKMYGASWGLKDIYELDPTGKKPPRAFGLTKHFTTPDGIEVLSDGTFIVSDSEGNQIVTVSPDEKTVQKIIETAAPADIGLDKENGLLYVPLFFESRVEIYQLEREK